MRRLSPGFQRLLKAPVKSSVCGRSLSGHASASTGATRSRTRRGTRSSVRRGWCASVIFLCGRDELAAAGTRIALARQAPERRLAALVAAERRSGIEDGGCITLATVRAVAARFEVHAVFAVIAGCGRANLVLGLAALATAPGISVVPPQMDASGRARWSGWLAMNRAPLDAERTPALGALVLPSGIMPLRGFLGVTIVHFLHYSTDLTDNQ